MKSAVIELLGAERPEVRATLTQTAVENEPVIAINDQLGYRAVEYIGNFQKHL